MHGRKSHKKHFNQLDFNIPNNSIATNNNISNNNDLLQRVRLLESENSKCCDCQSGDNVEWISLNILCVLCIRCSGVHRSLGSHISKIRSLTLDNFNDNLELIYLIKHYTSNKFVNEIYESTLSHTDKLSANCNDLQRSSFISNKYKNKLYIKSPIKKSAAIDKLLKAINSNNLWKVRYILARLTQTTPRQLSILYRDNLNILANNNNTLFQYTLQFKSISSSLFIITEFLLWNDMIIDSDKDKCPLESPDSTLKTYWNRKIKTFGTYDSSKQYTPSANSSSSPAINSLSNISNSSTLPSRSKSKKRWSLSYIPRSSTQHILNFNSTLKSIKDNSTTSAKK